MLCFTAWSGPIKHMRAKVSEEDYSWNAFGSNAHNFVLFIRTVRGIMTVESHFPKIQLTPFFYHVRSHTGYIYRGMLCVCFNFYNQIRQLCCKKRYEWIKIRVHCVESSKKLWFAVGNVKTLTCRYVKNDANFGWRE